MQRSEWESSFSQYLFIYSYVAYWRDPVNLLSFRSFLSFVRFIYFLSFMNIVPTFKGKCGCFSLENVAPQQIVRNNLFLKLIYSRVTILL